MGAKNPDKMSLWQILIPTSMNGDEILVDHHAMWDAQVCILAGGLTILKGVKGKWASEDYNTVHEGMIPVLVCCTPEQLENILDFTLEHYKQKEVFAFKISDEVRIKRAKTESK
jgi:hypothetical protein